MAKINVEKLITRNKSFPENEVAIIGSPCILCNQKIGGGIVLNDRRFICKACFEKVALVEYPEQYEILRRNFLVQKEARNSARTALIEQSISKKLNGFLGAVGVFSLLLLFVHFFLVAIPVACFVIAHVAGNLHQEKLKDWDKQFPEPQSPPLKHFHDPLAQLTDRDRIILSIFNHWPGYPPFWNYLREVVLVRDGHRCQVTGCPSRLELHIHHKRSVSKGGAHIPENLVALCDFHHALEPDAGHERIWATIKTRYFTLVRGHERTNRSSSGTHLVSAHLRRLELVSESELFKLNKTYGFSCPHCNSVDLTLSVNEARNIVQAECQTCEQNVEGPQELAEETGPRLAEILKPTKCIGQWYPRWDMLTERKKAEWGNWKKSTTSQRRKNYQQRREVEVSKPVCSICGSPMRLIQPKPGNSWKPFWGCTQFRVTGCKGSAKFNS